ncbi:MBL fold metallo-hydrolase [Candidatus Woesearchaeota archaeon]|nr:MBL fold metallo-hydrolase [Candidatus Woesearchaeota archaeon]
MLEYNNIQITWLGYSSFKIKTAKEIIYIDPFRTGNDEKADLIFITHEHPNHCSVRDIEKLSKESTEIICTEYASDMINNYLKKIVKPGDEFMLNDINVKVVHAYSLPQGTNEHFKGKGVGYILSINNTKIYHSGDTDFTPEMVNIRNIDIALVPITGMPFDQALDFVNTTNPKIVIPMHYDPAKDRNILNKFNMKVINSKVRIG